MTKAFTATLALILHEHGVIDLDRPVVTYLPQSVSISTTPEIGATITLRQLASHTSGLPRGIAGRVQSVEGWYQLEPQRLYAQLARMRMESTPGTAAVYSNLGFGLLGHALELAANKPLDQLMNEFLCDPLQLSQTSIPVDGTLRPATGYDGRTRVVARHSHQERLAGSGGLVTSVEDLATFLMAQMTPGYLSEDARQLQRKPSLPTAPVRAIRLGGRWVRMRRWVEFCRRMGDVTTAAPGSDLHLNTASQWRSSPTAAALPSIR